MIKEAKTKYPVIELIRKRWSARSFSGKNISQDDLNTILEAASWAASANNEQPWQYYYAFRESEGFQKLWECLLPGNQPWTKNASVLIASVARKTYAANQKENPVATHDLGMANSQLFLQATAMDIYGHPMAGFDKAKLSAFLHLNDQQEAICMIALGYLDNPEKLEEPFKTQGNQPKTEKAVGGICDKALTFQKILIVSKSILKKIFLVILTMTPFLTQGQTFNLSDKTFKMGDIYRNYRLYFDFNKATIRPENYAILDSIADFLIKNDSLIIEVSNHSDTRASDKYSTCLTCKRANQLLNTSLLKE